MRLSSSPSPISRPRAGGMHFSPPPGCIRCYASMWNRSRQGIQLTKQRLRDKLLAGPTSRSYFTRPLLSIGERRRERERERERTGWTERRVGEGWREKEQRKNVSAKQREFMDEQFYLRCPLVPSPRHNDPCIGQPHLPSFPASAPPPRPLQRSRLQHTSNNMPRVNYRLTLNIAQPPSAPFFFPLFTPFPRPNAEKYRSIWRFHVKSFHPRWSSAIFVSFEWNKEREKASI